MLTHPHRSLLKNDRFSLILGFIAFLALAVAEFFILDIELVRGNLGAVYLGFEIGLHMFLSILFGFFITLQVSKIRLFREDTVVKPQRTILGTLGGALGLLVVGCPACSITLAGLLGLGTVLVALPFGGLEVKILAILILMYVSYTMFRDLTICKNPHKKKLP